MSNKQLQQKKASPEIRLENVSKYYYRGTEEVHAVAGVSLRVKPASFLCLVGASGSGKSTLLHMIGCLDYPTNGKIFIDEVEVPNLEKRRINLRRSTFGYVFQQFFLIPTLSVEENVLLPLSFSHKKAKPGEVDKILSLVHLEHRKKHRPSQLSGGEMQRVAIARALMNDPLVLIADEPTGNLDSHNSEEMFNLFLELNKSTGKTLICATHNMELAQKAQQILTMKDGKLL